MTLKGLNLSDDEHLYLLTYKSNVVGFQFKIFKHKGSLRDANARAIAHCKKMNLRFQSLSLLVVDLDEEEKLKAEQEERLNKTGESLLPANKPVVAV